MLSGEGMQRRKTVKTTVGRISKSKFARAAHFFGHFFAVVLHDYNVKLPKTYSYTLYGGNVERVPFHFFSLPLIFTLHWWPLAFLILSPQLQNFHVVLPTKMSRSKSLSPFFSLSFAGLPFSCSIFQICGHDNLSKLNTLDNTDTETISAFRFRLY